MYHCGMCVCYLHNADEVVRTADLASQKQTVYASIHTPKYISH